MISYLHSADPGLSGALAPMQPARDTDPGDDARAGRVHRPWDARNGLPPTLPYVYRPGEAGREAEVTARVAAIRAKATAEWAAQCGESS